MARSVIVSAARTPVGSFQGKLSSFKSTELGSFAIREAVKRSGIDAREVGEVIMGCVLPAGLGQSPARQASLGAGIPKEVSVLTINKVCSSGLRSVMLADQLIRSGDCQIVVAGGMESMTNSPYLMPGARGGLRLGDAKIVDSMVLDGLWDIYTNQHMGSCAELCAEKYGFTRQIQDAFAERSYKKALAAIESGAFKDEIVSVPVPQKKGEPVMFDTDEEPGRVKFDKIPTLKASFKKDGTVTAANASSISDGGAAFVVMSEERAKKAGLKPLASIVAHATFSQEPEWFTTAPVGAMKRTLERAGLKISDVDLFEINEAFSAVTLAAIKEFSLDVGKVNVGGGSVAIGHPIGASGGRILTTLLYAMKHRGAKRGLATLCNGGGEATAMIVEAC
ncbi:MAG: acetyl-CoA C-acetyltransferase [Pseudomonadota bacterium]